MPPFWQGRGPPRASRGAPKGGPRKEPAKGEEDSIFGADSWDPSGDPAEAADAHNFDTFGLDVPVGDDWQPDEASYVQFEMMKKGLTQRGQRPLEGLALPDFFTTDAKGDPLEVVLESLEPEPPPSSSSSSSSRPVPGVELEQPMPNALSTLQQQQQQHMLLTSSSKGHCNSAATQHLTSLLLASSSVSAAVSSPSDCWMLQGPPPGFEHRAGLQQQQQQQQQQQLFAALSPANADKREAPFLTAAPREGMLLGDPSLQRREILQDVVNAPAAAAPPPLLQQHLQQQQQPSAAGLYSTARGEPPDLWPPPSLAEQPLQQQYLQQQQQLQQLQQQRLQQQQLQQQQLHPQERQQHDLFEAFSQGFGGPLPQQEQQQQMPSASDSKLPGGSRGISYSRQEQQHLRGLAGGPSEGFPGERPTGPECVVPHLSDASSAASKMPEQAAALTREQQQQQGRNSQQQQRRSQQQRQVQGRSQQLQQQQQQQQLRRQPQQQQQQQQKGRYMGTKQQQQQEGPSVSSRKGDSGGSRASVVSHMSAGGKGEGGGAPTIFPMTRGLINFIVKEKLPDATRWFGAPPPEDEAVSASAISNSSSSSSSNAGFMNAQDLDLILRVQLAQMARRPELQKYTGRWNFSGLRGSSGGPSGDLSPAELEQRLRELAGGGLLLGSGVGVAGGGDSGDKAWERLPVDCSQEGVLVSSSCMHQKLLGSLDPREAESLISHEERGSGDNADAEEPDAKNSSSNGSSSSAHKKFGKVAYSSIRHPRNMIHLEGAPSHSASAEDSSSSSSSKAEGGTDARAKDRSQELDLVRKLSLGWPGLSPLEAALMLKAIIEDCQDLRIAASSLHAELQECPASHVGARGVLQQQLQQVLLQAFELLTLRHGCVAQGFPLPLLLDFSAPAVCPSPSDYTSRLRHHYYLRQQQQQQLQQQEGAAAAEGFLERLPADLQKLAGDGRRSTRWILSSVCSSSKGLRLLLALLPMLPDALLSALVQGLLSCSEVLSKACKEADTVLAAAPLPPSSAPAGASVSSSLFHEVLRFRGTAAAVAFSADDGRLLHALLHAAEGSELAALWASLLLSILRVLRAAGPSRPAVLSACIELFCWGVDNTSATAIAGSPSGSCLFGLLTLHLPHADATGSPWQAEAARRFLCAETDLLVSLVGDHVQQPTERQQLLRLRPLVHALLQQARLCPAWAATITTRVTTLVGEEVARALLASLVRADSPS